MNKFVAFTLLLIVAFFLAKEKNDGKNPLFHSQQDKENSLEGTEPKTYEPEEGMPELEGAFFERMVSRIFINSLKTERGRILIEKMIQPMNVPATHPDYSMKINNRMFLDSQLHLKTVEEGAGNSAICGHKVNVEYKILNMNNLLLESGEKQFFLGGDDLIIGAQNLVVGMKPGEVRKGTIPNIFSYEHKSYKGKMPLNSTREYMVKVKLLDVESKYFPQFETKIFDDEISFKIPILCGDIVQTQIKISDVNGKTMFDSRPKQGYIKFRLGARDHPVILSHSLFNKQDKGTRTVIFKGKYIKSFSGENAIAGLNPEDFRSDQFYILEFMNTQLAN